MSEFHVTVVRLGPFVQHPNADSLDTTKVFDYTVVAKQGNFKEGELAVYVPVDSLVPDDEEWHWLAPRNPDGSPRFEVGKVPEKYRIIESKKIRGVFSQGCLMPLPPSADPNQWVEGMNVADVFNITKYDPPEPTMMGGDCEPLPTGWTFPVYTDIEGLRRYPDVLNVGEEVVATEKIHGANARYVHDGERLWVGSHRQVKREDASNLWWKVAQIERLQEKLSRFPFYVFFGEVYGQVQDLKYGVKPNGNAQFRVFDVFDVKKQRYLDFNDALAMAAMAGLDWVPVLCRGGWQPNLFNLLAEGKTTVDDVQRVGPGRGIAPADNVREGFVVRPVKERWDPRVGRVILKRHGEGYLLRKK